MREVLLVAGFLAGLVAGFFAPALAARFADDVLLLFGDGRWRLGPVREALHESAIGELYGITVKELSWDGGRTFVPA